MPNLIKKLYYRYGFFKSKAQQYKTNYSIPTINQSCPIPLLERRRSTHSETNDKERIKDENLRIEDFV